MLKRLSFLPSKRWPPRTGRGVRVWRRVSRLDGSVLARALCACVLLWSLQGCLGPAVGKPVLSANPNPSTDGSYSVSWTPIRGASRYRLYENGLLSYEGPARVHAYQGRAAGTYTYSLSYCVMAFDIEACRLDSGISSVNVVVTRP